MTEEFQLHLQKVKKFCFRLGIDRTEGLYKFLIKLWSPPDYQFGPGTLEGLCDYDGNQPGFRLSMVEQLDILPQEIEPMVELLDTLSNRPGTAIAATIEWLKEIEAKLPLITKLLRNLELTVAELMALLTTATEYQVPRGWKSFEDWQPKKAPQIRNLLASIQAGLLALAN